MFLWFLYDNSHRLSQEERRSAWRQRLVRLYEELGRQLQPMPGSLPSFCGVVYPYRITCGKPRCRCLKGQLHEGWCVSYNQQGRRVHRTIPRERIGKLREMYGRYRDLRSQRAELGRTFARMLELFDRLERSLRVAPGRVLPPVRKKAGRKKRRA